MSDFMKWLYASYIKPQIDASPRGEYAEALSVVENEISPQAKADYDKAAEFAALHAFQLGLRTGKGLADSFTA
nr:hypothetical protein [uncultured Oscillibacter sp.]